MSSVYLAEEWLSKIRSEADGETGGRDQCRDDQHLPDQHHPEVVEECVHVRRASRQTR